jgi:kumamolisin
MKFRPYYKHNRFKHSVAGASYTPTQLAKFYGFPSNPTAGAGKNLAVIELGGGFRQADLDAYFKSLGLSVKSVVAHLIDGATNTPGDPNGDDAEVQLDLCVAGALAPGAQPHCYFAPNTDRGFLDAVKQAVADKMDAISISWGGPEDQWGSSILGAFDMAFAQAATAGITVTAAAGDNGSSDGETGNHVDFPASSPHVLACGGTTLPSLAAQLEAVWNDGSLGGATGGGVSTHFYLPAYQTKVGVPGDADRGVPDVAGCADPNTGWIVSVDGQPMIIGGTSAVAPMWAAIAVVVAQAAGKNVALSNGGVYGLPAGCFRDITSGNNGTYVAKVGWDACTGLGAPNVGQIVAALSAPPAPVPPAPPAPTPTPPAPTVTRTITVSGSGVTVTVDGKKV